MTILGLTDSNKCPGSEKTLETLKRSPPRSGWPLAGFRITRSSLTMCLVCLTVADWFHRNPDSTGNTNSWGVIWPGACKMTVNSIVLLNVNHCRKSEPLETARNSTEWSTLVVHENQVEIRWPRDSVDQWFTPWSAEERSGEWSSWFTSTANLPDDKYSKSNYAGPNELSPFLFLSAGLPILLESVVEQKQISEVWCKSMLRRKTEGIPVKVKKRISLATVVSKALMTFPPRRLSYFREWFVPECYACSRTILPRCKV